VRVIHVLRKPVPPKGTVASNILGNGCGGLFINGCRIRLTGNDQAEMGRIANYLEECIPRDGDKDTDPNRVYSELPSSRSIGLEKLRRTLGHGGRWPSNLILEHQPDCELTGTQKVKGTPRSYVRATTSKNVLTYSEGTIGEDVGTLSVNYADENGLETIDAWDCCPGCACHDLDVSGGERKSTLTGHGDPSTPHEHPATARPDTWYGRGDNAVGPVYADAGGASRFFKQVGGRR
jgi:hypothetical protein